MATFCSARKAIAMIRPGDTVAIAGFLSVGSPERLIDELVRRATAPLHAVVNDSAYPDRGVGKLITSGQITELTTTHIGTNLKAVEKVNAGTIKVHFVPQGTLLEKLRCAGSGLGGFYTPTGVGTVAAEGKETRVIGGRTYVFETPLRPKFGLVRAHKADTKGNLVFRKTARNYNPVVAMAAEITIVQADAVVAAGKLDPESIVVPFPFVDFVVGPQ